MKPLLNPHAAQVAQHFWAPEGLPHVEIRTTRGSVLPYAAHFHHAFSLGVILQGTTRFCCAGEERTARQGELVLLEPGLVHSCNPVDGQPRSYHMLYLDAAWCLRQAGEAFATAGGLCPRFRVVADPARAAALCSLVDAICAPEAASAAWAAPLASLVREILTAWCQPAAPLPLPEWDAATGTFAEAATDGERQPGRVEDMARRAGLGREGYIRAFRRRTGLTPGRYGHCARIEAGRRLLRQGVSIAEAALATGYVDQSHFHRAFVKYVSATPRQYARSGSLSYKKRKD